MRRFVLGWKVLGHERRLGARIVNYADDFVICCRRGNAPAAMAVMRSMMERMGLAVNESKSAIRRIPHESVEFLGYTIGRCYSRQTGRAYMGTRPSKRSVRRATQAVSRLTARRTERWETESLVGRLNRMLTGWGAVLLPRPGDAGVSSRGCPYAPSVASMVVGQAQAQGRGHEALPRPVPLRHAGTGVFGAGNP